MPSATIANNSANSGSNKVNPGIRHVIDNLKYPDYIRAHEVFHKQNKIMKVFPGIGLPNMDEECEYSNTSEAKNDAHNLLLTDIRNAIYRAAVKDRITPELRTILNDVYSHIGYYYPRMTVEEEGRITLKFAENCGTFENKIAIKKGEGVFKAYNKLSEMCEKNIGEKLMALESMPYFKAFSTSNVPNNKKFRLIFSSAGEDGLWNIATISMRGINSCQTWGTPQSRGLIGSMSSKYVGVIFVTSGEKFNEHGSKMLRRSMVRFCINKITKKPALLCDKVYPSDDDATRKLFREFLEKKSGLPVLFYNDSEWVNYYFPKDSGAWKVATFQPNEFTYMDTKIPLVPEIVKPVIDARKYYDRIAVIDRNIINKTHATISKMLDEYCLDKKNHRNIFKGGVGNLLLSIRQHTASGVDPFTSRLVAPSLYNFITSSYPLDVNKYATEHDYERAVIRLAITKLRVLEQQCNAKIKRLGKFTRFYPQSIDKYSAFFMSEYKKELMVIYKNLINN